MIVAWLILRCVLFVASPIVLGHALWLLLSNPGVPPMALIETAAGAALYLLAMVRPRPAVPVGETKPGVAR